MLGNISEIQINNILFHSFEMALYLLEGTLTHDNYIGTVHKQHICNFQFIVNIYLLKIFLTIYFSLFNALTKDSINPDEARITCSVLGKFPVFTSFINSLKPATLSNCIFSFIL